MRMSFFCRISQSQATSADQEVYAPDTVSASYAAAESLSLANISAALRLLACLPVTSCEAERAFSKLGLIKSDLRSTMSYDRYILEKKAVKNDYSILDVYAHS